MAQPNLTEQVLELTNTIEDDLKTFVCLICAEGVKDARMCPSCSYVYCLDCIKKSLQQCNQECPSCRITLNENQLVPVRWLDSVVGTLNKAQPVCLEVVNRLSTMTLSQSSSLPESDESVQPDETTDSQPNAPCFTSITRYGHPRFTLEKSSVEAIKWSRLHSDFFFAAFNGGALGLFTVEPAGHPGRIVQTMGVSISLAVHENHPDMVCVGMRYKYFGVALYQIQSKRFPTANVTSMEDRQQFCQEFVSSPMQFDLQLVWKLPFNISCLSLIWISSLELIALGASGLFQFTMAEISIPPNKKLLISPDNHWPHDTSYLCMALQREPKLPTVNSEAQNEPEERKLAIGDSYGTIIVLLLSNFEICRRFRHTVVSILDWNPYIPNILVSGSSDGSVNVWCPDVCEFPLRSLEIGHGINHLEWSPFSSTVLGVMLRDRTAVDWLDLNVGLTEQVGSSNINDNTPTFWAFHTSRPLVVVGYSEGKGIECFRVKIKSNQFWRPTGSESNILESEIQKLKYILCL